MTWGPDAFRQTLKSWGPKLLARLDFGLQRLLLLLLQQ